MHLVPKNTERFARIVRAEALTVSEVNGLLRAEGAAPERTLYVQTSLHGLGGALISSGIAFGLQKAFPSSCVDVVTNVPLVYAGAESKGITALPIAEFQGVSERDAKAGKPELKLEKIRSYLLARQQGEKYDTLVCLDKCPAGTFDGLGLKTIITLSREVSNYSELALETAVNGQKELLLLPESRSIYQQGDLIGRALGIQFLPEAQVSPSDRALALEFVKEHPGRRLIYVHPGTSLAMKELGAKDWDEVWSKVARVASGVNYEKFLFVVSEGDQPRHATLGQGVKAAIEEHLGKLGAEVVCLPKSPFGMLRGILDLSSVVVCADTVVGHMAAALEKSCAMHFTNPIILPEVWQPRERRDFVNCRLLSGRTESPSQRDLFAAQIGKLLEAQPL